MEAKTKKTLIWVGVGIAGILIARHLFMKEDMSSASGSRRYSKRNLRNALKGSVNPQMAGGKHTCQCTDKWGNTRYQQCWRSKTGGNCDDCCSHYGKVQAGEWSQD